MRRVLAVLSLVLAGCGGGGDERLSQAEFEERANAICVELERTFDAMGEAETPAELMTQLETSEQQLTAAIADLRELEPPEESEAGYDRFLREADQLTQLVRDLRDAAATQNVARLEELAARGDRITERADEAAASVGLDECADD